MFWRRDVNNNNFGGPLYIYIYIYVAFMLLVVFVDMTYFVDIIKKWSLEPPKCKTCCILYGCETCAALTVGLFERKTPCTLRLRPAVSEDHDRGIRSSRRRYPRASLWNLSGAQRIICAVHHCRRMHA